MNRVQFFIDGFNLYHSLMRSPALRGYRWLNFTRLAESVLTVRESLAGIYFFTAFYPSADSGKTSRHETFIHAQALFGVTTVLGQFKRKDKHCNLCGGTFSGHEEKESDVNIALHVFKGAVDDAYDVAYILSNDSDLLPAIRMVRDTYPNKVVRMLFPPACRGAESLKQAANGYMRLKEHHLKANLFPDPLVVESVTIRKPSGW